MFPEQTFISRICLKKTIGNHHILIKVLESKRTEELLSIVSRCHSEVMRETICCGRIRANISPAVTSVCRYTTLCSNQQSHAVDLLQSLQTNGLYIQLYRHEHTRTFDLEQSLYVRCPQFHERVQLIIHSN